MLPRNSRSSGMASSLRIHMLVRNLREFSAAKCRYRSLPETLSVPGRRSKTSDYLRHDQESLCLYHDACCQIAIRKKAALWEDKRSEWQYSIQRQTILRRAMHPLGAVRRDRVGVCSCNSHPGSVDDTSRILSIRTMLKMHTL